MSPEWLAEFEALPARSKSLINDLCRHFERSLRQDPTATLESHLAQAPDELRSVLFRELLLLECEARARHGLAPGRAELERRFTGQGDAIGEVLGQALAKSSETLPVRENGTDRSAGIPDVVPEALGRFRPKAVLGRGGFGVVYVAHDPRSQCEVALKVPHLEILLTPELRRRFLREAEVARSLDHPNLVQVLDVGEVGLLCYIATCYVPGTTLAAWIKERRDRGEVIPAATAARLILTVAEAVQHAHERGILHCDIKPANILLRDGSEESPLLTDFGLARLLGDVSESSSGSHILGTPAYMAPEQAAGRRREVTSRTDVYALGGVLYTLLAGHAPFAAGSAVELLHRVLTDEPDSLRRLRRHVPAALEAVCLKCLDKNPERRYRTAADLAADLRRFLDGEPTAARPAGMGRRLLIWGRRRPTAAALVLAALGAVVFATAALLYHGAILEAVNQELTIALEERDAVNRELAVDKERLADREKTLRRRVYADQMRRAEALLDRNERSELERLLQEWQPDAGGEDLRGFEWHFLNSRIHAHEVACLTSSEVSFSVCYTPDGRTLISGERKGLVRIRDPENGRERCPPLPHPKDVNQVVCSPDGRYLATACDDGKARLWSLDGKLVRTWAGHEKQIHAIAFHPGGKTVVTASADGTGRLWNIDSDTSRVLLTVPRPIHALAFSPDGRELVFAWGGGLVVVDPQSGHASSPLTQAGFPLSAVCFEPQGNGFVSADRMGTLARWRPVRATGTDALAAGAARAWQRQVRASGRFDNLSDLAISPDGRFAAVAAKGALDIWSIDPLRRRWSFSGHDGRVWAVCFRPDGRRLVVAGNDGTLRIYDFAAAAAAHEPLSTHSHVVWLDIADSGDRLVLVLTNRLEEWRKSPPGPFARALQSSPTVTANPLALSPNPVSFGPVAVLAPQRLAVRTIDSTRRVRDWIPSPTHANSTDEQSDLVPTFRIRGPIPWTSMALAPDKDQVAAATNDRVQVWDLATGKAVCSFAGPNSYISTFAFGPRGLLATGTIRGKVFLWDISTGALRTTLMPKGDTTKLLTFSPSGRLLAGTSRDGMTTVWDLADGRELVRFSGSRGLVHSAAFTPDEKTLATGGVDGSVRLWQVATGLETIHFPGEDGLVTFLAFSRNGRFLASAARSSVHPGKGVVRIWDCGTIP